MTETENKSIVDHWVSLLYLKNYLATLSSEELCEFASDFNFFQSFLGDSKALFKEEPVFLLLDSSFLEKISDVVNCYRFQFSGKLVSELSNEIIENINSLLLVSDYIKRSRVSNYLLFQEEYRNEKFVLLMILSSLMLTILLYLLG